METTPGPEEQPDSESPPHGSLPSEDVPPDTSDHPSDKEKIGGQGAEEPGALASEERYRKGPGW